MLMSNKEDYLNSTKTFLMRDLKLKKNSALLITYLSLCGMVGLLGVSHIIHPLYAFIASSFFIVVVWVRYFFHTKWHTEYRSYDFNELVGCLKAHHKSQLIRSFKIFHLVAITLIVVLNILNDTKTLFELTEVCFISICSATVVFCTHKSLK